MYSVNAIAFVKGRNIVCRLGGSATTAKRNFAEC